MKVETLLWPAMWASDLELILFQVTRIWKYQSPVQYGVILPFGEIPVAEM